MKKRTFCTIPTWTKFSFLHRNSKLVILTKHPTSFIEHWKCAEAMICDNALNGNSWSFFKSLELTLRTPSWGCLERMGGALGTNKITKRRPQSCNESNLGVILKALGNEYSIWQDLEMHATRWLASVHIVFLKRLADFLKNMKICTIPTWRKFSFLRRNPKMVILIKWILHQTLRI